MQITSKALQAVLLAAAKNDIRTYLNAVLINSKHIVATDGKRMHVLAHGADWQHGPILVPRESVELALKSKLAHIVITPNLIGAVNYTAVVGIFPDYKCGMPKLPATADIGPVHTQCNPDYLKDAVKAVGLATQNPRADVSLTSVGGTLVWCDGHFMAVVMPLRDTEKYGKIARLVPIA